jgi:hypothetical protein
LNGTIAPGVGKEFARQREEPVRRHEEQLSTTMESSAQQVAISLKTKEEVEDLVK